MTIRVLVADDQDLIRDGLAAIIDSQDDLAVVGTAADGAEAIRAARNLRPHITLMDIRMPGTDGLEATRQLLADAPPATRVVMLTTFDEDDLVVQALQLGASGFLLKDLKRDTVRISAGISQCRLSIVYGFAISSAWHYIRRGGSSLRRIGATRRHREWPRPGPGSNVRDGRRRYERPSSLAPKRGRTRHGLEVQHCASKAPRAVKLSP